MTRNKRQFSTSDTAPRVATESEAKVSYTIVLTLTEHSLSSLKEEPYNTPRGIAELVERLIENQFSGAACATAFPGVTLGKHLSDATILKTIRLHESL